MAFRDGKDDYWAWSGALMISDTMDDLARTRAIAEAMAGVKERHRKK